MQKATFDSRQQDGSHVNRQDQLNSQFARTQISSYQERGPAPALVKVEVPWSARRGSLYDKDHVLKTVKGCSLTLPKGWSWLKL
ncbi:hypothetical protein RIF29_24609 [Crotalaria pallida]|uniref:Uncharacterized protein n=1 Tax=Crotalaria pallida TaxID=3830 RepID=A0AAN9I0C3_CROPI